MYNWNAAKLLQLSDIMQGYMDMQGKGGEL